jgi:hypothetical protein
MTTLAAPPAPAVQSAVSTYEAAVVHRFGKPLTIEQSS